MLFTILIVAVFGLVGASLVLLLVLALLTSLRRLGVWKWMLGPFRAWTGWDETRRPKP